MALPSKEEVIEAIRPVTDPEINISIVDLGLVYDVEINDPEKQVDVKMTLTSPACPCLLYTSPSPRDRQKSRMPSSA